MFEVKDCSLEPDKRIMALRFALFAVQGILAVYGFLDAGYIALFVIWILIIILFLTVPRRLICARCDGYGRRCYSMYLGLYTSKLFSFQEKDVPAVGLALEAFSLVFIPLLPLIPLYRSTGLFALYLLLSALSWYLQFVHACRYCAVCSKDDWKRLCPARKAAAKIWRDRPRPAR